MQWCPVALAGTLSPFSCLCCAPRPYVWHAGPVNQSTFQPEFQPELKFPPHRSVSAAVSDVRVVGNYSQLVCGNSSADGVLGRACAEAARGLAGMLGEHLALSTNVTADNALVLHADAIAMAGQQGMPWPPVPAAQAFQIGSGRGAPQCAGFSCTLISGPTEVAVLYGVFRYLSSIRRAEPLTVGYSAPATPLRMWDLWASRSPVNHQSIT